MLDKSTAIVPQAGLEVQEFPPAEWFSGESGRVMNEAANSHETGQLALDTAAEWEGVDFVQIKELKFSHDERKRLRKRKARRMYEVAAVRKALEFLCESGTHPPSLSASALTRRMGMPSSSTHDLLRTLGVWISSGRTHRTGEE